MSKKRKKHGYYGINSALLGYLWSLYKSEGPNGLLKKQNVRADYKFKLQVIRDIEENHLPYGKSPVQYRALFQSKRAS